MRQRAGRSWCDFPLSEPTVMLELRVQQDAIWFSVRQLFCQVFVVLTGTERLKRLNPTSFI